MTISVDQLLKQLKEYTQNHLLFAESLKQQAPEELNKRLLFDSWSVLECLQHLNLYGDFYIPELNKRIAKSATLIETQFKSGWLGNYFAKSMLPKENLNKMKTFKSMNPIHSALSLNVIDVFIDQQKQLLALLEKAQSVSLNKVKTSISITPFIKLKLGDTLRVVIYHNERHIVQANKILEN